MPRNFVSADTLGLPAESRISRRAVMAALPVSGAALAMPSAASSGETEILRLFRRYMALVSSARSHDTGKTGPDEDEEMERDFYRPADRLEKEIMALPSTCAADFAAKVILDSQCGEAYSSWSLGAMWREARALTGLGLDGQTIT